MMLTHYSHELIFRPTTIFHVFFMLFLIILDILILFKLLILFLYYICSVSCSFFLIFFFIY